MVGDELDWYAMDSNALHTNPIQSIANAFHRNGIDTIAMDTDGLTAHGVAAAGGRVAARLGSSRGESAGKPPPGPKGQPRWGLQNGPLRTNVRRAIITIIAQLSTARIAPHPAGDSPMTVISDTQIVPRPPPSLPALRAADQGVADALEAVLSDNTRRVYGAQWRLFNDWRDSVVLRFHAGGAPHCGPLPGGARRLAAFAIVKIHQWAGHDSPAKIAV